MSDQRKRIAQKILLGGGVLLCLLGVLLRFYRITANNFFLFDEGYYMDLHRQYLELIAK